MPVDGPQYPVNLLLDGRDCLVVGGGTVAARKAEGLLDAGGRVRVVASEVRAEVRALGVPFQERPYQAADLDGVWLAIAATDDPSVNAAVRADGDAARVWVNAADDPASCSFTLPAVVRQGPVTVTVGTGGHSPALAAWLKGHVATELGPEVAELAGLLSEARQQVRQKGGSTEEIDWRPALDWDMLALIRAGDLARARERVQACLSSS